MGKETLIDKLRDFFRGLAWSYLLWSSHMTEDEYWEKIYSDEAIKSYKQEKKESQNNEQSLLNWQLK